MASDRKPQSLRQKQEKRAQQGFTKAAKEAVWQVKSWDQKNTQKNLMYKILNLISQCVASCPWIRKPKGMVWVARRQNVGFYERFDVLFVLKAMTFWQAALPSSYSQTPHRKGPNSQPDTDLDKDVLADARWNGLAYFSELEGRRWNDRPRGKKKSVLEKRASWLRGNQSQAGSPCTILQQCLEA